MNVSLDHGKTKMNWIIMHNKTITTITKTKIMDNDTSKHQILTGELESWLRNGEIARTFGRMGNPGVGREDGSSTRASGKSSHRRAHPWLTQKGGTGFNGMFPTCRNSQASPSATTSNKSFSCNCNFDQTTYKDQCLIRFGWTQYTRIFELIKCWEPYPNTIYKINSSKAWTHV